MVPGACVLRGCFEIRSNPEEEAAAATLAPTHHENASLITWKKYGADQSTQMKDELQTLSELTPISDDLFEIVSRGLKD